MPENTSQIIASILLGSLPAFISNSALRYAALAIIACLAVIYTIYVKHPSTQLRQLLQHTSQLQQVITTTKELTRGARQKIPRDHLSLTAEWARLLAVEQSASRIKCRVWETEHLTWNKYRLLANDIAECSGRIKSIRAAVQCTVEVEHQRKLAENINETEFILACARSLTGNWPSFVHKHLSFGSCI
ncbi:hypothetical protein C8R44DRAFT_870930 [Mycena epipterygia]|nr:hypothetical protein C8R44DRAFT_870930 [Mycena epipterygia]